MPVTYKEFPGYPAEPYLVKDAFQGAVLSMYYSSDRIMSDVWEDRLHAIVWDAAANKTRNIILYGENCDAIVDATPEVIAAYRKTQYDRLYSSYLTKATEDSNIPFVGSVVIVRRGRKDQGKVGKVVYIKEMPYQTGWRSTSIPKLCIALDGSKTTVQGKYGKTFERFTNVIWVWSKNCDVANPKIDIKQVEDRANFDADDLVKNLTKQYKTNHYA